jgi:hypothetical protein
METPKPSPSVLPPQEEFHVLCLSGGAWKGALQYWVMVHLLKTYNISLITGVSVGSINGVMAAMGMLDELLEFWNNINGLRGYLRLRLFYLVLYPLGIPHLYEKLTGKPWMGGLYSMEGLHSKLKADAKLARLEKPFIAGTVSFNTGRYYSLDSRDMSTDEELQLACLASSCMAPFMTPPLLDLGEHDLEGRPVKSVGFDGGGKNIFPVPKEAIAAARSAGKKVIVHAVGCMPLDRIAWKDTVRISGLLELALRGLEVLQDEIYHDDLMGDLRKAVGPEGEVHGWLPAEHPGGSFEASPDIIQKRLAIGKEMVEAGPSFILKGL